MKIQRLLLTVILILLGNTSFAQSFFDRDSVFHNPRFYFSAGSYHPTMTTSLRLDSDIGLGTVISLEDDIKLAEELTAVRVDGTVRVKKRSQFMMAYTTLRRNRELIIDEDIDFKDTTFYVDASVRAYFDINYFALSWRYSLLDRPNWNAGFSVGMRIVQIKTGLQAKLNTNSYSEDVKFNAPALLVGIHGGAYLLPRLLGRYSLEYFQVSIADLKIIVIENRFSMEYFVFKNVGVGAGYEVNSYRIKDIPLSDSFSGRVNLGFGGFNLFLSARF
jgi:hypothetical protein